MKDVPIQLAAGIVQAAVLERADHRDFLVTREAGIRSFEDIPNTSAWVVATSSIRRRAQWLNRFSKHSMVDLRGNIATRLQKLHSSKWNAAIFAAAALERLDIDDENFLPLDWMVSAPAQGAILIVCKEQDQEVLEVCTLLEDPSTALEVFAERSFLKDLMGGCATPIGASAKIIRDSMHFLGNVLSPDGKHKIEISEKFDRHEFEKAGQLAAKNAIDQGAKDLLRR
jgi:hydroxymethylbilane synthase